MVVRIYYIVVFLAGTLVGLACENDNCTVSNTRCSLNRAEICGSDHNWHINLNCNELGGETVDWICCYIEEDPDAGVPAGHMCLPGRECPALTDADADAEVVDGEGD